MMLLLIMAILIMVQDADAVAEAGDADADNEAFKVAPGRHLFDRRVVSQILIPMLMILE